MDGSGFIFVLALKSTFIHTYMLIRARNINRQCGFWLAPVVFGFFGGVPQLTLAGPYVYTYFYVVCSAAYYVPLAGLVPRCMCGLTGVVGI